jgi:hypothetical protein
MLTEYFFEIVDKTPKIIKIVATSKNEAEKKLKAIYGERNDLKLIDSKRIIY